MTARNAYVHVCGRLHEDIRGGVGGGQLTMPVVKVS
jgi:hypothetical protein